MNSRNICEPSRHPHPPPLCAKIIQTLQGGVGIRKMPIFEYVCEDCGTKFEKLVRNGDAIACPSCGQSHLATALSTFAAHSNGKSKSAAMPACPGGMCRTPDICGRE
ncbi:MAG: zinc ribbon domain-containing protein [Bryobacteraceae bacterium]